MAEIIQIIGYKNSGKTTLAEYLVKFFSQKGLKVAVIKHDAHEFEMDHAGTDTWRMTQAGAAAVAISSPARTALIEEQSSSLEELITRLGAADLIVVEGFKQEHYPKIVMLRSPEDLTLLEDCSRVIAAVCAEAVHFAKGTAPEAEEQTDAVSAELPSFKRGEHQRIAEWLQEYLRV
ncbi:molybdopterin-guanine dinucleotide biosynthesis protein B [Paenibacillus pinistramenti]|uniref:molybdopterin-guanine dinucleotide biosynthesis protein B n=1 Tax=Paenibacillus pinistramenti TaxID=1768003 RepID=UPI0011094B64|nr:molybdopterin-guanine dinucleotide biosynthesis protein B [Paenibacillus pinistramenti]